ncbi:MAG: glycosyltransferase 87 family protein, partial [Anaerolineae bacterium]
LYPTARSIVLGQFTILVLALVALALWALERGRGLVAGCSLALATIKPQMVILLLPFLLLRALKERHRTLTSFLATLAILLLLPSLLLPTWIPSFLAGLSRYQAYTSLYTGGRSPLGILLDFLLPSKPSFWATLLISLILGGYLIYEWVEALKGRGDTSQALFLTIIVTLLIPVQTGTTNQVLLLLPLIYWLSRWTKRRWVALSLSLILFLGPWTLFLATVRGDAEQPVMFLPLPLFALTYLLAIELRNSIALRRRDDATS